MKGREGRSAGGRHRPCATLLERGTVLSLNVVRLSLIVVNCDLEEWKEGGREEPPRTMPYEEDEARIKARPSCILTKPPNAIRKSRDVLEEERRKCM